MRAVSHVLIFSMFAVVLIACGHGHDEEETTLTWEQAPPSTATAGMAFDVEYHLHAHGDLHHTEVRLCSGADVAGCGAGDATSFDENVSVTADGEHYSASVTIDDPGAWTIVGFAHVGEDPHTTDATTIDVQ